MNEFRRKKFRASYASAEIFETREADQIRRRDATSNACPAAAKREKGTKASLAKEAAERLSCLTGTSPGPPTPARQRIFQFVDGLLIERVCPSRAHKHLTKPMAISATHPTRYGARPLTGEE